MRTVRTAVAALAVASMLGTAVAAGPASAQADTAALPAASGFDGYWVLAVGTGVAAGVVVATVLTDGLILPAYAWAAQRGGMFAGLGGAAASEGAMAAGGLRAGLGGAAAAGESGALAAGGRAGLSGAGDLGLHGGAAAQGLAARGAGPAALVAGHAGGHGVPAATAAAAESAAWSSAMLFRRGMQALGGISGGLIASDMYGG